jgi:peroxiredoxin
MSPNGVLRVGDQFPAVTLPDLEGSSVTVPELFGDQWGVVLFYRGHW